MIRCPFCGTIQIDPIYTVGMDCPDCGVGILLEESDEYIDDYTDEEDSKPNDKDD